MTQERINKRIKLAKLTNAPFGAGAFIKNNVLILGEQSAKPEMDLNQLPFCSIKHCSGWLNKILDVYDIPEEQLFWLNVLNNDGSIVDLIKIIDVITPRCIIALGGIAQKQCFIQNIECIKCFHPQYWKRFKSKEKYPLVEILKKYIN